MVLSQPNPKGAPAVAEKSKIGAFVETEEGLGRADRTHGNVPNIALGVSVGALVGTLIGISIVPPIGLPVALLSATVIGGVVGTYAKRIAARMHPSR